MCNKLSRKHHYLRLFYILNNDLFLLRGLYPNLVKDNVKKNMETLAAVGLENYVIQGNMTRFALYNKFWQLLIPATCRKKLP
jgi:hypothetical protein